MAETARRNGSGLGADVARRLLARPIQRQALWSARPSALQRTSEPAADASVTETIATETTVAEAIVVETHAGDALAAEPIPSADLAFKLEAQILVMKAVLAAERRENASLRACIGLDDAPLGEEAVAVRDRWAGLVDKLLQAAV